MVLAAYFAGLAAGAVLGGGAVRNRRPLVVYAGLEVGVVGAVLGYLALRPLLPAAAVWLVHTMPAACLPAARALLALVVLALPTTLLGATLPVAAAALDPERRGGPGRLYAWNTLGGAGGALAAGLLGVRLLGVRGAFLAAAAVDLLAAAVALALGRDARAGVVRRSAAAVESRAALLVAAAAGFAGLADEILWTRGLAGVLSNSVYSVALVLAAVLVGLVLGARLGSRAAERPGSLAPRLAAASALLALATVISMAALRVVPEAGLRAAQVLGVAGPGSGLVVEALLAVLVVLAPAVALGAVFPLCVALAGGASAARATGRVLAANTAGGIAGALAGAFVLLPGLGFGGGLLATAALALVVASALAGPARPLALVAAAAVAAGAFVAPRMQLAWRDRFDAGRLLFYRDGAAATVLVTADARDQKRLRVNGQYSLGGTDGLFLERRQAHLPLLLHPAPTRLLALGVGTADTIGAAARHPGLQVDGIELVPEVLQAAALFEAENGGALRHPRVHLTVDDARTHLLATPDTYDVILSDLFLPWTAGTATLYARETYALGLAHLRPGGLYCQWLPLHQLGVGDLASIVATFVDVFPSVQLWVAYHRAMTPLAALIGSRAPLHVDAAALAARLADPTLARALAEAGLDDARDLGALYVSDGLHLRTAVGEVATITDDRPRLEFTAPAAYFHQQGLGRSTLAWVADRLDPGPAPVTGDQPVTAALRSALLRAQLALLAGDRPAELDAYRAALGIAPDVRAVRTALAAIGRERLVAGDRRTAVALADDLRRLAPGTPETERLARAVGGALSPDRPPDGSAPAP